jgi:competence protein ComGC
MGEGFATMGLIGTLLAVVLAVIYILLPVKLWRMADRIKEINENSKKQTELLGAIQSQLSAQTATLSAMNTQLAKLLIAGYSKPETSSA